MGKDVIVACDFDSMEKTLAFLDRFEGQARKPFVKIGMELYYAEGPQIFTKGFLARPSNLSRNASVFSILSKSQATITSLPMSIRISEPDIGLHTGQAAPHTGQQPL